MYLLGNIIKGEHCTSFIVHKKKHSVYTEHGKLEKKSAYKPRSSKQKPIKMKVYR